MRRIKLRIYERSNFYIRKASADGSLVEIQNQYSGIIVKNPRIRFSLVHGVHLVDNSYEGNFFNDGWLQDTNSRGFEQNAYTRENYRG
jgi:pectate lyase